jgi:hypothetical protein
MFLGHRRVADRSWGPTVGLQAPDPDLQNRWDGVGGVLDESANSRYQRRPYPVSSDHPGAHPRVPPQSDSTVLNKGMLDSR